MNNLRDETIAAIEEAGQSPEQIVYIGDRENSCTWPEFLHKADVRYDAGYGSAQVNSALVITFEDGSWLERAEYDGAEWWAYKKCYVPAEVAFDGKLQLFHNEDWWIS